MKIGIDLGTTYSAAAYLKDGKPETIINSDGDNTTPSVVLFEDDGSITIGSSAKERALIEPENVVSTVKNEMGTQSTYERQGAEYNPEEISSMILKKIVQDSQSSLGEDIEGVVVTIPAYFSDAQRKATEDACSLAGINLIGMINEPTSAAICYMHDKQIADSSNVLVYDLGGGTFDVSIVKISEDSAEVVATGGLKKTGGHFFDQKIREYVIEYIYDAHEIDLTEDEYTDILQEINNKAEKCKIRLSSVTKANIILRIGKIKETITITREEFKKMIRSFYKRTESIADLVLADAGLTWKDIDRILLVGGSSRIPYIREQLKEHSGIEPSADINPDEAVAFGAAIYANNSKLKISDVCSHSLGVVTINEYGEKINSIIIRRNSPLPVSKTVDYVIPADGITDIILEITEGEDEDIDNVSVFSSTTISLDGKIKKGTPVSVEFMLEENQLLKVFVKIKAAVEISEELHIDRKSNLTKRELRKKSAMLAQMKVQ